MSLTEKWETCPKCEGDGVIQYGVGSGHYEAATGFSNSAGEEHPCPGCAHGLVPPEGMVFAASRAISAHASQPSVPVSWRFDVARAALVAAAKWVDPQEGESE